MMWIWIPLVWLVYRRTRGTTSALSILLLVGMQRVMEPVLLPWKLVRNRFVDEIRLVELVKKLLLSEFTKVYSALIYALMRDIQSTFREKTYLCCNRFRFLLTKTVFAYSYIIWFCFSIQDRYSALCLRESRIHRGRLSEKTRISFVALSFTHSCDLQTTDFTIRWKLEYRNFIEIFVRRGLQLFTYF